MNIGRSQVTWQSTLAFVAVFFIAYLINSSFRSRECLLLIGVAMNAGLLAFAMYTMKRFHSDSKQALPLLSNLWQAARDPKGAQWIADATENLLRIQQIPDPVFRRASFDKLTHLQEELKKLAHGCLDFESTEAWRSVYQELLESKLVFQYRSVVWIHSADYFTSQPAQNSLALNIELTHRNAINLERIVIVTDNLWPVDEELPHVLVLDWINEHTRSRIAISLVRERSLIQEPELLIDFGIYGSHAVGYQTTDEDGKTIRYQINFDVNEVNKAEQLWMRLKSYSILIAKIIDKPP